MPCRDLILNGIRSIRCTTTDQQVTAGHHGSCAARAYIHCKIASERLSLPCTFGVPNSTDTRTTSKQRTAMSAVFFPILELKGALETLLRLADSSRHKSRKPAVFVPRAEENGGRWCPVCASRLLRFPFYTEKYCQCVTIKTVLCT